MSILPTLKARIENGKIVWKDFKEASKMFSTHNNTDVVIIIQSEKNKRSLKQNSYYHAVVIKILSDELGYSEPETNDILKGMFLSVDYNVQINNGETITVKTVTSTKDLSTSEMEDFLSRVRGWASANLNVFIPLPNEVVISYGDVSV